MTGHRDNLPTGIVTFLFTDIEGSTRLLAELGVQDYAAALTEHRERLRAAFAAHDGVEIDTQGDAFFIAFPDARAAISSARDAQEALAGGRIRVRMGLHTGAPHIGPDGYVGHDVHLGARIAAAGHGGQVLVSRATRGALGEEFELVDLGEHRVKDFPEPVWIYQLGSERFPPLKTISNTNLPRPASSFVGREREVAEITALLRDGGRLVTLTGPGGTGKTRLSVEAAAELVPDFKNGTFWVPLASVRDHTVVTETIGRTLGAKNGLADHIGEREMLLLIDNLEQVVAAAPEIAVVVESCANLRVLTTSREVLRVRGEVEYAVPPLAEREAVDLFTARTGLPADDTVKELCRQLENLPLAVELAAARASVLTPRQIIERLSGRLDLLKGGRDSEARQQTLRAAIEWSYDLLETDEKQLFANFAVFAGGATLEAVETVVDADIDTLQALVNKSLVRHSGDRFWMLETIREFAAETLVSDGKDTEFRERHAEYFLALAERLEKSMVGPAADAVNDALERDHANLRAALDYFEATDLTERAMRLAGALAEFWDQRAHHKEALARYVALLSAADSAPTETRAKVLDGAANMALMTGDATTAWRWQVEALEINQALGNKPGIALALWGLGYMRTEEGRHDEATDYLNQAVQLYAELGDSVALAWITRTLAHNYSELGDLQRAEPLYAESLDRARAAGDRLLEAHAAGSLASIAALQGRARDAAALARQSLLLVSDARDPAAVLARLTSAAHVLAALGQPEVATRLLAHVEERQLDVGAQEPWALKLKDATLTELRAQMDPVKLTDTLEAARQLTPEAAITLGVSTLEQELATRGG